MNTNYEIKSTSLQSIHDVLLEILLEIDRICKTNGIKYFLSGGTLLGAVRHGGFIPWDDDLDIWMTRSEFKKFKKCLKDDLNHDKFICEDYFTNKFYPLSILKIKRKDTIFIEKEFANLPILHMLYVDIFPLDHTTKFLFPLQCALLTKCQSIRMYLLDKNKKKYPLVKRIFYSLFSLRFVRFLTEFNCRMLNIFNTKFYAQLCHRPRFWPIFSKDEVNKLILHEFEAKVFPIPHNFDSILKRCYGDYMKLPPIEKQCPSHDVVECSILFSLKNSREEKI